MKETRNVIASPAASLDQIWIKYGYDETKIAVKDKEAFLEELLSRNPDVQIERKAS